MSKLIMYYWAPCPTCAIATKFADENGIELDLRDVEQEGPYNELLALGGDANKIPYLYVDDQLFEGLDAVKEKLATLA
jgi:glutaredoxin